MTIATKHDRTATGRTVRDSSRAATMGDLVAGRTNEHSDSYRHRRERARVFREVDGIWKDLVLELMAERMVLNRWCVANGGSYLPDLNNLKCNCHAHNIVKAAIRDMFAERGDDIDRIIGPAVKS